MSTKPKSTTLYPHPFSAAYWRDAAAELKDFRMLVIAAMMVALRVALKPVSIPLAPNLNFNVAAPLINALGAMIFGPVVAGLAACVSDTLGCILFPTGVYFFPCMFVEVAGSMLMAMFFYRARISVLRVILARFSMDLLVNIVLNSAVMFWYYKVIMGKSYAAMLLPAIIKNLCFFPLEAILLTVFLAVMIPVTYRMKLTYDGGANRASMRLTKPYLALLAVLFAVGVGSLFGYMTYYYNTNTLSKFYSTQEQAQTAKDMYAIITQHQQDVQDTPAVAIIDSAYRAFPSKDVTYNVSVYQVDPQVAASDEMENLWALKKTPASKHEALTKLATADITIDGKTGEVLSYIYTPVQ